jgi:hypothetical protein
LDRVLTRVQVRAEIAPNETLALNATELLCELLEWHARELFGLVVACRHECEAYRKQSEGSESSRKQE